MVSSGLIAIGGSGTSGGLNQSINVELGLSATANSNLGQANFRTLAGVATGVISMSNFYGKSNLTPKGYYYGGFVNNGVTYATVIQGINLNTEARSNPSATVALNGVNFGAVFNTTACYLAGGSDSNTANYTIVKFLWSTEARTTIAATINTNQWGGPVAVSNGVTYGYWISAIEYGPKAGRTRIQFSNETTSYNATTIAAFGYGTEGCNTTTQGWARNRGGTGFPVTTFTFSTEVAATVSAVLVWWQNNAGAQSTTVGYWWGGHEYLLTNQTNATTAVTFSTGVAKTVSAVMSYSGFNAGASQTLTAAYIAGGYTYPNTFRATYNKFTFSTETMATIAATLSVATAGYNQGFQNNGVL